MTWWGGKVGIMFTQGNLAATATLLVAAVVAGFWVLRDNRVIASPAPVREWHRRRNYQGRHWAKVGTA